MTCYPQVHTDRHTKEGRQNRLLSSVQGLHGEVDVARPTPTLQSANGICNHDLARPLGPIFLMVHMTHQ